MTDTELFLCCPVYGNVSLKCKPILEFSRIMQMYQQYFLSSCFFSDEKNFHFSETQVFLRFLNQSIEKKYSSNDKQRGHQQKLLELANLFALGS